MSELFPLPSDAEGRVLLPGNSEQYILAIVGSTGGVFTVLPPDANPTDESEAARAKSAQMTAAALTGWIVAWPILASYATDTPAGQR